MAKKNKPKGVPNAGNRAQYDAMMEIRRSSAASPHDKRPNRERSRHAAKSAAIRNSYQPSDKGGSFFALNSVFQLN